MTSSSQNKARGAFWLLQKNLSITRTPNDPRTLNDKSNSQKYKKSHFEDNLANYQ